MELDALSDAPVCPRCGAQEGIVKPGTLTHFARLACGACGRFLRWLPKPKDFVMVDMIAPPSAPMVGMPSTPDTPPVDVPDDIPDPPVPEAVTETLKPVSPSPEYNAHEALLHGFCQALQKRVEQAITTYGLDMDRTMDKVYGVMLQRLEQAGKQNEHALYQFADAAKHLSEGPPPYQATVQAKNAAGFPVTIQVAHRESGTLVEDMTRLLAWMQSNGYTPVA